MRKLKITVGVTGTIGSLDIHNYILYLQSFSDVSVIITEEAEKFIKIEAIKKINENVYSSMWDQRGIPHTYLGRDADVLIIFPASANSISKISHGFADNLLCATALNYTGKILFAPNMNDDMWNNPILQDNIKYLENKGHIFVNKSKEAYVACRAEFEEIDAGLPNPKESTKYIYDILKS